METSPITMTAAAHASTSIAPSASQSDTQTFHPHLLLVRWELQVRKSEWSSARNTAQALIAALPNEPIGWIYRGFAEQQLGRLQDARDTLLSAARRFPADWRIAYNLAVYLSQLGDRAGAWNWLDRAAALGKPETVQQLASDEPALQALGAALGSRSGDVSLSLPNLPAN